MLLIPEGNLVGDGVFQKDKLRSAEGNTETLSLTYRVALMTLIVTEEFSIHINISALFKGFARIAFKKSGVITVRHKAYILTLLRLFAGKIIL